ncbi:uncharacterized protein Z520_00263 [Fonsecaea multimorphosa CBS 102226]|uniref:RING-type domain-containing protein n=1 Tax=Fonsecaea multimorphosa CBS 102226 TaxID=1442371 RepID=A0A0D2J2D2_9EURO|nr:uncharacterized protein Z520_00263 [Fonsecaea multimorphosa CBS 102226]KIY03572.1 hypothetical protein Z520_00263 [Fonsecaea multimorphosa CBS 102226]
MEVAEIDTVNAVLAIRLELQDLVTALPEVPSHEEIAQTRDRISTLLFQLEELATFDAEQSNERTPRGGDENQLLDQPSGNSNLRVVGRDGYYEDPRIKPDGRTSLEAYMHDLDADEVHPPEECYICMQQTPYSQLIAHEECEHVWCRPCLSESFESALKNESHYPVRCCRSLPSISHESPVIVRLLGEETIAKLKLKIKEYETADRTYCYEPTCSTFIDPDTYINGRATCRSCAIVERNSAISAMLAGRLANVRNGVKIDSLSELESSPYVRVEPPKCNELQHELQKNAGGRHTKNAVTITGLDVE